MSTRETEPADSSNTGSTKKTGFKMHNPDEFAETGDAPRGFPSQRFKYVREIGFGATGSVCLGIDRLLSKQVAIKLLKTHDEQLYIDFQNEARAVSLIDHPNVLKVLDFSVSESGAPYMVCEYIDGVTLRAYIEKYAPLAQQEALRLIIPAAEALSTIHQKNIFHRDLKPENIIVVNQEGEKTVKLVDFGLSKFKTDSLYRTETGDVVIAGTPTYMSPDLLQGNSYDARCDIYSLATILFETLTGKPPFTAESALQLLNRKCKEDPPSCSVVTPGLQLTSELEEVLQKGLARDPERRFQTMLEFASALNGCSPPGVNAIEPTTTTTHNQQITPKKSRANSNKLILASVALFAIILTPFAAGRVLESNLFGTIFPKSPEPNGRAELIELQNTAEGLKKLDNRAVNGDHKALLALGDKYFRGLSIAQDYGKALDYYKSAARLGNAEAENRIGWMYEQGLGVKMNLKEAKIWYRKAAEKNSEAGKTNIARALRAQYRQIKMFNKPEPDFSPQEFLKWNRLVAERGDPWAASELASCYSKGEFVKPDPARAVELWKQAAKTGNGAASLCVYESYLKGFGVKRDLVEAQKWKERAQASDPVTAIVAAARPDKLEFRIGKAEQEFSKKELAKNPEVLAYLGARYLEAKDYKKALSCLTTAASKGSLSAKCNLGYMYDEGVGVKQDYNRAFRLYSEAAAGNDATSLSNLAEAYELGHGTKIDTAKALELYTEAAAQKFPPAELALGRMYEKGIGAQVDIAKSKYWYRKAAFHGDPEASKKLYGRVNPLNKRTSIMFKKVDGNWVEIRDGKTP